MVLLALHKVQEGSVAVMRPQALLKVFIWQSGHVKPMPVLLQQANQHRALLPEAVFDLLLPFLAGLVGQLPALQFYPTIGTLKLGICT
jgi:hypothetical protein